MTPLELDRYLLDTLNRRGCARIIRDTALSIVCAVGHEVKQTDFPWRTFEARRGNLTILLRTRVHDPNRRWSRTFVSPYGIDIWRGKKVFNVEWGYLDNIDLVAFIRAEWEQRLIEWAHGLPSAAAA